MLIMVRLVIMELLAVRASLALAGVGRGLVHILEVLQKSIFIECYRTALPGLTYRLRQTSGLYA